MLQARKRSVLGEAAVLLCLGLLAVLIALQWLQTARRMAAGADPTVACADNLRRLGMAVTQYAQDNDERLPPMQDPASFKAAVMPFARDAAVFNCPETGLPYTPNAALNGKTIPGLGHDYGDVEVARDSRPHADGLYTVLFFDGHVEHGGAEVGDPVVVLAGRESALASAVVQYTQDNDEILPAMHTPQELQAAVTPYVNSSRVFSAPGGRPFVPTAALSGVHLSSLADISATVILRDAPPYLDGVPTLAYGDGHLERGGIEYGDPNAIAVSRARQLALTVTMYAQDNDGNLPPMHTPQEFRAALAPYTSSRRIFANTNGSVFVPNAALSGVGLFSLADPASAVLFQDVPPYTDGAPTTAYADDHVTHVVTPPRARILWTNPDGRATLWFVNPDSTYGLLGAYGPYVDGGGVWKAVAVATGPDGVSRILWTNPDGRATLWYVNPDGAYGVTGAYGPYADRGGIWKAGAVSVGPDSVAHILWTNPDGRATLWYVSADNRYGLLGAYGPYVDGGGVWRAASLSAGPDNVSHILWTNPDGRATLWYVSPTNDYGLLGAYGPYSDRGGVWQAAAVATGQGGVCRILWGNPDGRATLWHVSADGAYGLSGAYGPYSDSGGIWKAGAVAAGPDDVVRILWTNPDGRATLWYVNPDDIFGLSGAYGPYIDSGGAWRAVGAATGP